VEEKTNGQVDILSIRGNIHRVIGPVEEILKTETILKKFELLKIERKNVNVINENTSKTTISMTETDLLSDTGGYKDASYIFRSGETILKEAETNETRAENKQFFKKNASKLDEGNLLAGCNSYKASRKKSENEKNQMFNPRTMDRERYGDYCYRSCMNGKSCKSACHSSSTIASDENTLITACINENVWRYLLYRHSFEYEALCKIHGCNVKAKRTIRDGKMECHLKILSLSSPERILEALADFHALYEEVNAGVQMQTVSLPVRLVWEDVKQELNHDGAILLENKIYSLICPTSMLEKDQERRKAVAKPFEADLGSPSEVNSDHYRITMRNGLVVHILQGLSTILSVNIISLH